MEMGEITGRRHVRLDSGGLVGGEEVGLAEAIADAEEAAGRDVGLGVLVADDEATATGWDAVSHAAMNSTITRTSALMWARTLLLANCYDCLAPTSPQTT